MQFPVPQFTDVEDRIVGSLSFKQFGFILAAGVFTFMIYSISKSPFITIAVGVFSGLPALALAFGRLNGRPLYASTGNFIKYLFGAKRYVFHKQAQAEISPAQTTIVHEEIPAKDSRTTAVKIKELNYLLQQQASEEATLLQRIKDNKSVTQQP
jgi:hypothetical protein